MTTMDWIMIGVSVVLSACLAVWLSKRLSKSKRDK
jgi:hypothetical protein